jgi:hypothetical protein
MDFREATDALFQSLSHDDLARALGVSVATIRQARLSAGAKAHRNAPEGWAGIVRKLAEQRSAHFTALSRTLAKL